MKAVMPVRARGPLAGVVMEQPSAWLEVERYAQTVVPQVLGVTRGLSAWMDDRGVALGDLTGALLDAFAQSYGVGVPGHALVKTRVSVLRRFFTETGILSGDPRKQKRTRRPVGQPPRVVGEMAGRELDRWARWQREARGISEGCIRYRRAWVADLVESLPVEGDASIGAGVMSRS